MQHTRTIFFSAYKKTLQRLGRREERQSQADQREKNQGKKIIRIMIKKLKSKVLK